MAAELKEEFGVAAALSVGTRTGFYVLVDGETVFSTAVCGRFPRPGEVSERIRALDDAWRDQYPRENERGDAE